MAGHSRPPTAAAPGYGRHCERERGVVAASKAREAAPLSVLALLVLDEGNGAEAERLAAQVAERDGQGQSPSSDAEDLDLLAVAFLSSNKIDQARTAIARARALYTINASSRLVVDTRGADCRTADAPRRDCAAAGGDRRSDAPGLPAESIPRGCGRPKSSCAPAIATAGARTSRRSKPTPPPADSFT